MTSIFATFPNLQTSRLILRQLRPEDAMPYSSFSPTSMSPATTTSTASPVWAHDLIARFQARFDRQIGIRWGLALSDSPNVLIGTCGYNIWVRPAHRSLLGYDLNRRHWGQGLMGEALRAILDFGFDAMQLNRVEALTFPQNTASKRLLTKLGFKKKGLLREYEYPKGSPQDMAIYALLARERLRQINQT